jgi:hypothetical protein
MIWGKTNVATARARRYRQSLQVLGEWRFAFFPLQLGDGRWVWLEEYFVRTLPFEDPHYFKWRYEKGHSHIVGNYEWVIDRWLNHTLPEIPIEVVAERLRVPIEEIEQIHKNRAERMGYSLRAVDGRNLGEW